MHHATDPHAIDAIRRYLVDHIARTRGIHAASIDLDVDVFEHGYVDSLGVFALVLDLENAFRIRLHPRDLLDPRMTTLNGIADLAAARAP